MGLIISFHLSGIFLNNPVSFMEVVCPNLDLMNIVPIYLALMFSSNLSSFDAWLLQQ